MNKTLKILGIIILSLIALYLSICLIAAGYCMYMAIISA